MKIRITFTLTEKQRRAIGCAMELGRVPTYEECRFFLESQGMMGVEQAMGDYDEPELEARMPPEGKR